MDMGTFQVFQGDCIELLKSLNENSVTAIITDPPYNVGITNWDKCGSGKEYRDWCTKWGKECFRVLKPGGAILSFCGSRTYQWLAVGLDEACFVTRDMLEWLYFASFAKGKNLKPGHEPIFYGIKPPVKDALLNIDECRVPMTNKQRNLLEEALLPNQPITPRADIWSTTQSKVRGKAYNSIVGKKVKQWKHTTNPPHPGGRVPYNIITNYTLDNISVDDVINLEQYPYNIIDCKKPRGEESIQDHPTQKPIQLMMWLIKLVSNKGDLIVDPFAGSGTTGEAALLLERDCILIEKETKYLSTIQQRLNTLPNKKRVKI